MTDMIPFAVLAFLIVFAIYEITGWLLNILLPRSVKLMIFNRVKTIKEYREVYFARSHYNYYCHDTWRELDSDTPLPKMKEVRIRWAFLTIDA